MNASYLTNLEILANYEREINKIDNTFEKPATDDSLFWLNQAVAKFVKLRYNGDFVHKTSYEQNDKRRMDLMNLFVECKEVMKSEDNNDSQLIRLPSDPESDIKEYGYTIDEYIYPKDFMYALNEDVIITDSEGGNIKPVSIFECTADSFMYRIMNSLTDFHYKNHYARPIRVRTVNGCKLLTDGKYKISNYTLGYLRYPEKIVLGEHAQDEYKEFPEHIMHEIIKIAAQMYIENQKDERYRTLTNEVLTQE